MEVITTLTMLSFRSHYFILPSSYQTSTSGGVKIFTYAQETLYGQLFHVPSIGCLNNCDPLVCVEMLCDFALEADYLT